MTERYTMDAQDLYDGDRPLRDTDIMDRLNEQDDDLTRLREHIDAEIIRLMRVERDLRARLDTAYHHIGALVADGADEDAQDAARSWLKRTSP